MWSPRDRPDAMTDERGADVVEAVSTVIDDARVFDYSLRLERVVTLRSSRSGESSNEVSEELWNLGPGEAEIGVLYHVNLGAPVLAPGSRNTADAGPVVHRRGADTVDPVVYLEIAADVVEHVVEGSGFTSVRGHARVSSPVDEVRLNWGSDAGIPRTVDTSHAPPPDRWPGAWTRNVAAARRGSQPRTACAKCAAPARAATSRPWGPESAMRTPGDGSSGGERDRRTRMPLAMSPNDVAAAAAYQRSRSRIAVTPQRVISRNDQSAPECRKEVTG